jgi:SAM-dependent methyltransferase
MSAAPGPVALHYDSLLAKHYTWAFGDVETRASECEAALFEHLPARRGPATAVDLGAGPGYHSLALARLGYRVTAIDRSAHLLAELRSRASGLGVVAIEDDLRNFRGHVAEADVVCCMGDTLPHLPDHAAVFELLQAVRAALGSEGVFLASFRDLGETRTGLDRIIPVRADDSRIFTCFLEYLPQHVWVHDVVHVREPDGWHVEKSAYRKLRLSGDALLELARAAGLHVRERWLERGLVHFAAGPA